MDFSPLTRLHASYYHTIKNCAASQNITHRSWIPHKRQRWQVWAIIVFSWQSKARFAKRQTRGCWGYGFRISSLALEWLFANKTCENTIRQGSCLIRCIICRKKDQKQWGQSGDDSVKNFWIWSKLPLWYESLGQIHLFTVERDNSRKNISPPLWTISYNLTWKRRPKKCHTPQYPLISTAGALVVVTV